MLHQLPFYVTDLMKNITVEHVIFMSSMHVEIDQKDADLKLANLFVKVSWSTLLECRSTCVLSCYGSDDHIILMDTGLCRRVTIFEFVNLESPLLASPMFVEMVKIWVGHYRLYVKGFNQLTLSMH